MIAPKTKRSFNTQVIVAYAMVYVVWGSTFFFIYKALAGFEPFMLGAVRYLSAGILMLGWYYLKGNNILDWKVIRSSGITGLLLLFVDTGIIIWVEQYLASGLVAIMAASAAIWFIILDKPMWKKNFRNVPILVGLFLGFMGVVMLFGDQLALAENEAERRTNLEGMILLVLGAIAWTGGSLYSKYFNSSKEQEDTNSMVGTGWQIMIAGVAFALSALFRGEVGRFNPTEIPAEAWGAMLYLIVFGSIIAYSSYIWLLKVRPATEVSTYAYVNPIVAVALSYFLTDDTITSVQITGLVVILTAVLMINWDAYMGKRIPKRVKSLRDIIRTKPKMDLHKPVKRLPSTEGGLTEDDHTV